jgi:hypothetical protein
MAAFKGDGTMWTSAPRLSQLNGIKWSCEGDYNSIKEAAEVRVTFDTSMTSG